MSNNNNDNRNKFNLWLGNRSLTEDELQALAESIVAIVKERGPFHSLANFINRDIGPAIVGKSVYLGPLEEALLVSGVNAPGAIGMGQHSGQPLSYFGSDMTSAGSLGNTEFGETLPWSGALQPGWVSQADILQLIAPAIQTRSDTFKIRSYGEVSNAFNGSKTKTWCEAIVTRTTDLTPSIGVNPNDIEAAKTNATGMGRQYKIVRFRWLNKDEI